jgi:zinc/manganese transport system substrate-binding protein
MKTGATCAVVWMAAMAVVVAAPMRVASLNTVMADLAREVGGGRVEVVEVVAPGIDPHLYEPTPGDLRVMSGSRLVLAGGLGFEGYLAKLQDGLGARGVGFVVGGEMVSPVAACSGGHDHDHGHDHGEFDPHWWHSVGNARRVAAGLRDAFIEADPEGRGVYEENWRALDGRLARLEKWVRLEVAKVPRDRRVLVTSHDALGYFADEHGFEVLPVRGISTGDQPSSRKVKELIEVMRQRGVRAIFAESIENPRVLEQIIAETGARRAGVLHADGLGGGGASTYEGMMRSNVSTMVEALR